MSAIGAWRRSRKRMPRGAARLIERGALVMLRGCIGVHFHLRVPTPLSCARAPRDEAAAMSAMRLGYYVRTSPPFFMRV